MTWEQMHFECLICSAKATVHTAEWPPMLTVCPTCSTPLGLVGADETTKRCTYRKLKTQP